MYNSDQTVFLAVPACETTSGTSIRKNLCNRDHIGGSRSHWWGKGGGGAKGGKVIKSNWICSTVIIN